MTLFVRRRINPSANFSAGFIRVLAFLLAMGFIPSRLAKNFASSCKRTRLFLWVILVTVLCIGTTVAQDDDSPPPITADNAADLSASVLDLPDVTVQDFGWTPDGASLLILTDSALLVVDLPLTDDSQPQLLIDDLNANVLEIAAPADDNPDGFTAVTVNTGASIGQMWQISADLTLIGEPQDIANPGGIYSTAIDPANGAFVSGSYIEGTLRYWSPDAENMGETMVSAPLVESFAFNRDGTVRAVGNGDGVLIVDEVTEGALVGAGLILFGHLERITALAFSPPPADESTVPPLLASGDWGGLIYVWDVSLTEVVTEPEIILTEGHINVVESLVWSADGSVLVSQGADDVVRFWDMRDPATINLLLTWRDAEGILPRVAFSPDGAQVAFGYADDESSGIAVLSTEIAE